MLDNGAEFFDIFVEGVDVDGLVLGQRTAVIDGLGGEEQQSGYIGRILDAQSDECEGAQLGCKREGFLLVNLSLLGQQGVELLDEGRIELEESLVEAAEEDGSILLGYAYGRDRLQQVFLLVGFDLTLDERLVFGQLVDVLGTKVDIDVGQPLTMFVGIYQSFVQLLQLIVQLCLVAVAHGELIVQICKLLIAFGQFMTTGIQFAVLPINKVCSEEQGHDQ